MYKFLLYFICTCFLHNVLAQEEYDEKELTEPFMGMSVAPQEKHEIQIVNNNIFQTPKGMHIYNNEIEIEYGFTDKLTAEIGFAPLIFERYNQKTGKYYTGNIEIGGNYSFMNIFNSLHLSVGFEFEIPISTQGAQSIEYEPEFVPYLICAYDFSCNNPMQIYAGIYPSVFGDEKEIAFQSGVILPFDHFQNTLEFSYLKSNNENISYFAPGVAFPFDNGFELGLSAPIGISERANPYEIMLRLFYEF